MDVVRKDGKTGRRKTKMCIYVIGEGYDGQIIKTSAQKIAPGETWREASKILYRRGEMRTMKYLLAVCDADDGRVIIDMTYQGD